MQVIQAHLQLQQPHRIAGQAGEALRSDGSCDKSDVEDVEGDEDGDEEHVDEGGKEDEDGSDKEDGSDEDDCGEDGDADGDDDVHEDGVDGECISSMAVPLGSLSIHCFTSDAYALALCQPVHSLLKAGKHPLLHDMRAVSVSSLVSV